MDHSVSLLVARALGELLGDAALGDPVLGDAAAPASSSEPCRTMVGSAAPGGLVRRKESCVCLCLLCLSGFIEMLVTHDSHDPMTVRCLT